MSLKHGMEVKSITRVCKKPGDIGALTVGISIDKLEPGQYELILHVEDLDTAETARKSIWFRVVNPGHKLVI